MESMLSEEGRRRLRAAAARIVTRHDRVEPIAHAVEAAWVALGQREDDDVLAWLLAGIVEADNRPRVALRLLPSVSSVA